MKKKKTEQVDESVKTNDELQSKYLRALADYQNLEKRFFTEKVEAEKRITINLISRFLEIKDDIERALQFSNDENLSLINRQFSSVLNEIGTTELDVLDKPFDPNTADAIEVVEGERDNQVVEVIRKGYRLGEAILRHAQVKVSQQKTN